MSTSTKSRVIFKTDTKENWEVQEYVFSSLKGQLYFYSDYTDTGKVNSKGNKIYIPQLKIGDGISKVSDLSFIGNNYITFEQIDALLSTSSSSDSSVLGVGILGSFTLGGQ